MKNKEIPYSSVMPIIASCESGLPLHLFTGNFMEKICGIYKITNPRGRVYIGQSVDIYDRWGLYKRTLGKGQTRVYNSIKKHGIENHKFEIIHQCLESELNELEVYYIQLFGTFNSEYGMNLRAGGFGHGRMSNESKLKMSIAGKGRKKTEEHKRKIGLKHKGKKIAPHHIKILKERIISLETRKKMSDSQKRIDKWWRRGKKMEAASKQKISNANKGKIPINRRQIIDISNGEIYSCKKEAANALGIKERTLKAKLLGKIKNNTTLRYASEYTISFIAGHSDPKITANNYIHGSSKIVSVAYSPIDSIHGFPFLLNK